MGFLDDIFGGGGGSPDITQAETLTASQRSFLDLLTGSLEGLVPQGLTPFTGPRVAGTSPLQQQGFGLAGGLAPGIGAGIDLFGQTLAGFDPQQGQGFLGQAGQALQRGTQPFNPQTIIDALAPARQLGLNVFEQDVVPFLSERFGATSRGSGAFNQALAEAGANLGLGLSAQAAGPIAQGALQAPGLQLQGAGLGGNLAQIPGLLAQQGTRLGAQGTDILSQLLNIGGVQRGISQQQISGAQAQAQDPRSILAQFGGLGLGTQAFENIVQPQGPGLGSALLPSIGSFLGQQDFSNIFGGGGGAGGGLGGGGGGAGGDGGGLTGGGTSGDVQVALQIAQLFCDRRLKDNIEPIEDALDKVKNLEGSTYNFLTKETRDGGIMAQDLEGVLPEAVQEVNGVKMVKIDAVIGLLVNAINELRIKVETA